MCRKLEPQPVWILRRRGKSLFDGNDRNFHIFTTTVCGSFGPKRDEVTREWRKLHNEELHVLYSSPNIARVITARMRWARHVARMGEERGVYRVLVGKPERKETTVETQAFVGG
jgi:hypothetical protein